jgi:hypothetical protein
MCSQQLFNVKITGTTANEEKPYLSGVTIVLGAGNQDILSVSDVFDRMILHNEVVVLKHHPLRQHLYGIMEKVMKPLLARGFFAHFQVQYISPSSTDLNKGITRIETT